VVLIACVVGWFVVTRVIPNNKYQRAVALRENGQYDDAIAAFAELGEYSDVFSFLLLRVFALLTPLLSLLPQFLHVAVAVQPLACQHPNCLFPLEAEENKRLTVAFVLVVLIACVVGWFVVTRVIPNNKYQRAVHAISTTSTKATVNLLFFRSFAFLSFSSAFSHSLRRS